MTNTMKRRTPLDPRVARVGRNSVIALAAVILPAAVALFAIPLSLRVLGPAEFGIVSLAWVFLNFLTLTDLGMSKAVVLEIGERLDDCSLPRIVGTSVLMTVVCSAALAVALLPWLPDYAGRAFATTAMQRGEIATAAASALIALPLIAPSLSFRGALEALGEFGYVHVMTAIFGSISLLVPPMAGITGWSTSAIIIWMLASRVILTLALAMRLLYRIREPLRAYASVRAELAKSMASFGGWVTVGDIVGPAITGAERLIVSGILGLRAVGVYSSVYEAVFRIAIIPAAVAGALFPVLAGPPDRPNVNRVGRRATSYDLARVATATGLSVIVVVVGAVSAEGLRAWLGAAAYTVVEPAVLWLLVAVTANGLARLPATLLHSARRSRPVTLVLCGELVLCVPGLIVATRWYGIEGAAAVVAIRGLADLGALHYLVRRSKIRDQVYTTSSAARIELFALANVGLMAVWARLPSFVMKGALTALSCGLIITMAIAYRKQRAM